MDCGHRMGASGVEGEDGEGVGRRKQAQESVTEVDEVEDVVVPMAKRASSQVVSTLVGSLGVKVLQF
jgi:hypothetical protein